MIQIEDAIGRVEKLYRTLTGHDAPAPGEVAYAPIPAEKDPSKYVEEQLDMLLGLLGQPVPAMTAAPPISVWEGDNEVLVCVELPGVSRDQLEVSLVGNFVTVTGVRPPPAPESFVLRANERPVGAFRRAIPLPIGVRAADLSANLRDGVLEIRVPKEASQAATPRTIPVK